MFDRNWHYQLNVYIFQFDILQFVFIRRLIAIKVLILSLNLTLIPLPPLLKVLIIILPKSQLLYIKLLCHKFHQCTLISQTPALCFPVANQRALFYSRDVINQSACFTVVYVCPVSVLVLIVSTSTSNCCKVQFSLNYKANWIRC